VACGGGKQKTSANARNKLISLRSSEYPQGRFHRWANQAT
jgi:hypothetical protein